MLLSNLSSANEIEARKKKSKKKKSSSTADDDAVIGNTSLKRCTPGEKPIIYSAADSQIPREKLMGFLTTCAKMLFEESNMIEIIKESNSLNIGLHEMATKFQCDVLEYNYQIERVYGCKYLSMIPNMHAEDTELVEAMKSFMLAAMKGYVNTVHLRYDLYQRGEIKAPNPTLPLTRKTILEFFEACNATMSLPAVKEELRMIYQDTKEMPGKRIIELQRNLLTKMGYTADFGVSCLNRLAKDFPDDRELNSKFQSFASCAEFAGTEAAFTEQQRKEFYTAIPALMYHTPHVFVMQQRMYMMQQQQKMQQSAGQGGRMDADTLKASGLLGLLTSPDGRMKLQSLASRVQIAREKLEPDVKDWSSERRQQYYESFTDHPLVTALTSSSDPLDRVKSLIDMSDGDIDELMTLLIVIAEEDKSTGNLLVSLRSKAAEEAAANLVGNNTVMSHIVSTLGSLSSFTRPTGGASPSSSSSSSSSSSHHHHQHTAACQHSAKSSGVPTPDVASGKVASMER